VLEIVVPEWAQTLVPNWSGVRRVLCLLALFGLGGGLARAQANPDFEAVPWIPLSCNADPLTFADPRPEVNLVGDATFPAFYSARDATYLYFRYRVDGDPRSSRRGFLTSSDWTTIVQVPSGNPFQYQYQLALNGDGSQGADTVEIWANTVAEDVTFDPLFTDESDTNLFSQVFDVPGVNTTPLARAVQVSDGSELRNDPDFFVDVAFPIQALLDNGVIATAADLDDALFFPATGTSPNRHNKDNLNCRFLPLAPVTVAATFSPNAVPANTTTRVTDTITVHNAGPIVARGITLTQPALAAPLTFVSTSVSADNPAAQWTVVSQDPLQLSIATLPAGATLTVQVVADARPGCSDVAGSLTASADGINVAPTSGTAVLTVQPLPVAEVCDGIDNDCDGQIDEGGDALCIDQNVCNGTETCAGAAGCQPGTPLVCENPDCTTATCEPGTGCVFTGCACHSNADCADTNPCTTDTCDLGTGNCFNVVIPSCMACTTSADCADTNACTDDVCNASGVCEHTTRDRCTPCTTVGQCDDGDQCTNDACEAGVCTHAEIPGCRCIPVPEVCNDGADNDCDGLTDCADPDCAAAPPCIPPQPENCSNCVDDDGDGLIDAEDPDCCAAPMPLGIERLTLRPNRGHGQRLRLQAAYAAETPRLFDPLRQDTSVLLSDAGGPLFCTRVAAAHWHRARRLLFRFTDRKGSFAGGLESGDFRIIRDGRLMFSARARSLQVRTLDPGSLRLTIGVGTDCSRSTVALRPARGGLTFP
jgi:hypothetical protein